MGSDGGIPRLHLASASPRRTDLLRAHGFEHTAAPAPFDDSGLRPGDVDPREWVASLALMKAWSAQQDAGPDRLTLAADTVVELDGRIIGQAADAQGAIEIIESLADREHAVLSGVALVRDGGVCDLFVDESVVRVGTIPMHEIEAYVTTGAWRGKAGAYNLVERIEAGWPIECSGDPTSVMGLPMHRLAPLLRAALGIHGAHA